MGTEPVVAPLAIIIDILARHLREEPASIRPGDSIVDDIGADSLDIAEIILEVEDRFAVRLGPIAGDADLPDDVRTVEELAECVSKVLKGGCDG